jgi:WD40 repeat protein
LFIWRIDRPDRPARVLLGHHGDINMLGYGPDGRIVTAGSDRTVRVWNPATGTQVVLRGHQDEVDTARFAPGGSQVISVSDDGTVRLWDAHSGNALAVLDSGAGPLGDFAVSRDDRIATLSKAGIVRVFGCEVCGSLQHVVALARARVH